MSGPPPIRKLGTIDCDMVETTPVAYRGRLWRFEYVRVGHRENPAGPSHFRFVDVATGERTPAFAQGRHLGVAYAEGEWMTVFGVPEWGASRIEGFRSRDLRTWEAWTALDVPRWGIYNTSVCRGPHGYVMAIELGEPPEEVGVRFTIRFAESADLRAWRPLPAECVHTKERYSACPSIRWLDGHCYMVYLEAMPGPTYETHIVRSRDLRVWEPSPHNPVLHHSDADKGIANPALTEAERKKIAGATNLNNSDMDLCEWRGRTVILYSWGNQQGVEFLAEASSPMPLASFLRAWFEPTGSTSGDRS